MSTKSRVKEPQQDRSRESLERVFEAGLDVLVTEGWHDFTLNRVCERAGVSVGMLYRRFHGREELLTALQNRWIDDAAAIVEDVKARAIAWDQVDAQQAVRTAIHGIAEGFRRNETWTRLFGLHGAFDDAGLQRLQSIAREYAVWFRTGLMHHRAAITHPYPDRAIDFSYRIVLDTMIRRTTHGDEFATGTSIGNWDDFENELYVVCSGYLFTTAAASQRENRVTAEADPV